MLKLQALVSHMIMVKYQSLLHVYIESCASKANTMSRDKTVHQRRTPDLQKTLGNDFVISSHIATRLI